ncbi:putative nutrient reservoir [Heracleum sosnowskyi]|uniref:Nutrient reservoir n=1 Tax=Heracleum sosnowskyi TaxID=360622 RepID=A0AAD8MK46_9APIA|nr:putative nutrient reservoir [Heracleum sosnowskyi]
MILLSKPTFGTSTSTSSAQGLFCISECETCPVICAPPPPPTTTSSPPPSPIKPPPDDHSSPPDDQSYYFDSPPPPKKANPPPSYITWGQSPTSPSPPPPPPSPDLNYVPVPGAQGTFPSYNTGQKNSSNPYYYFYASKGSFFTPDLSLFLMVLLFSHAIVYCC